LVKPGWILQKQVVSGLLGFSDFELRAVKAKPRFLADIVSAQRASRHSAVGL
jgi:hypothetical protein